MGDTMNLDFLWDETMVPSTFNSILTQLRSESYYFSGCSKTKCLCLTKIFKLVSQFPEIYLDFSLKVLPCVTEMLENMLIFYVNGVNAGEISSTSPTTIDETLKDLFTLVDDTIISLSLPEDPQPIHYQSLLCMGVGNLLMTCLNHLEKGRIGHLPQSRFIESCKAYFKFLALYDREFVIAHIHPHLESMIGCLNNFSSNEDGVVAVVRFIMESCRKSSMVSRIVKIIPGESPAFLAVVSAIVQFTDDDDKWELAKDPKIFPQLKRALKSSNTSEIKYATFFIKSLTSYFAREKEYEQLPPEEYSELLLNLPQSDFIKYWTNFFDLFEVLEEKQIHIIQPFFPKLDNLKLSYEACADWYFVIVYKMLQHDNRGVAKEGATKFIEYAEIISTSSFISEEKAKAHLFQFIMKTILPILKDHVGWIFKEGEEFFGYAKRLGKVLSVVYRQHGGEVVLTEKIMGYVKSAEKGLSAHFLFFLMLTLDSANEEIVSLNSCLNDEVEVNNPDISLAFELVVNCLNHSLTTIDKFMSREIQKVLVNITVTLLRFLKDKTKVHFRPSTFFLFIGGLSQEIFCDIRCFNKLKPGCFDAVEGKKLTESTAITSNESLTSTLGQLRCLFVPWLDDKESSLLDLYQISRLKQKEKRSGGVYTYFISDLYQCFDLLKINQIHSSEFIEYVNPNMEDKVSGILDCFKTAAKIILDGEVAAVNFVSIIRELHSLRLICNTSGRIKENLSNAIFMENHSLKFRFGSCILNNFLLCKLWLIISQISPEETLRDKLPVISFEGFEAFFLSESVDDNIAIASLDDELFVDFLGGENVLSILYQLKFNVFASIVSISYPNYTSLLKLESFDAWKKCLSIGLDNMDLAGKYGVIASAPFFIQSSRCIKDLQFGDLEEILENFVKLSWKHLDEQRKTDVFWKSFSFLVDYMTTTYSIQKTDSFIAFAENVLKYGETIMGVSIVLMEGLKRWTKRFLFPGTITDHKTIYENLLHVCVLVATYGPPMVKTLKVDFQLWEWLISRNSDYNHDNNTLNANNFTSAAQSRILAIFIMQVIFDKVDDKNVYLNYVVDKLLKINEEESIFRKRYFNNSTSHRLKQRISQTLLALQHLFTREVRQSVTKQLLGSLANDSSQPSVRYLMEWVIIRNLACENEDWDMFFEESIKCSRAREGFGAFFATICLHTIPMLRNDESSKYFFTKALKHLTDLLLGKHFTVRVYSLITFRTIYETALAREWKSVIQPFEVIYESLDNFCKTGNFTRIHQNIVKDFYVNLFHAETNHNFPVIFIHLPRIAGMANDEIIPEVTLKQLCQEFAPTGIFEKQNCPSLECDEKLISSYKELTESVWLFRAVLDGRELGEMTPIETVSCEPPPEPCSSSSVTNLQKKMNPWKFLPLSDDISEFPEQLQLKKKNLSDDGLVVVASLIDRVPNLGGLCRTCEIFGVSKYVISSMKILDDAQFKNLSVSAHNWVDLLEVPVKDLETFLASYASKGYSIVGVEQAIESAGLNSFTFPKKTLLLLGNEKFGIPTNLLHLVDQCLEIPQVGVIRSLNVHVTGALCIWQYACQHSI